MSRKSKKSRKPRKEAPEREAGQGPGKSPEAAGSPESTSRRHLIEAGVCMGAAAYAGAIGYPVYRYLVTPARRAKAAGAVTEVSIPLADLPQVGEAMMFRFGVRPTLLIHKSADEYVVLDAVCTHLGCTVQFQPEQDRIYCACHSGVYDPDTGANRAGPPPSPLKRYQVEVQDEAILVRRG